MKCPFCTEKILKEQSFYENELALALYNFKPLKIGHTLIIPKRHEDRFENLSDEEVSAIGKAIKDVQKIFKRAYASDDYTLVMQNGKDAGQTVFHSHFHMVPRKKGDIGNTEMYKTLLIESENRELISDEEMEKRIKELKDCDT